MTDDNIDKEKAYKIIYSHSKNQTNVFANNCPSIQKPNYNIINNSKYKVRFISILK
jgi:hypothetical protein